MAYIEFNALSVILCGSFSAKVFLPEMKKMYLDDEKHEKKYPVLWLLHSEGGSALDWVKSSAERCAVDNGIIIVAPDVQHTMCTNMEYGPKFEDFCSDELLGIFRHVLPISENPELNWIGGTGTGSYGALKIAIKHPDIFSRCIAIDSILDIGGICRLAAEGKETGIFHKKASLEAVFGDLSAFEGSENDLYQLAGKASLGEYYLCCHESFPYRKETEDLAALLGDKANVVIDTKDNRDGSCLHTLVDAVGWLCKER
jgi:S-formylglutathione hydrolase FrmB